MGSPRGVTHSTVSPALEISHALSVNQSCKMWKFKSDINMKQKWAWNTVMSYEYTKIR